MEKHLTCCYAVNRSLVDPGLIPIVFYPHLLRLPENGDDEDGAEEEKGLHDAATNHQEDWVLTLD